MPDAGSQPSPGESPPSLGDEQRAVLATLQQLFDAMANHDEGAMRETLIPGGAAVHSRGDRVLHTRLDDLPGQAAAGTERLEERIHDPLVRVDDDIAMVWAPYDFLVDGVTHHWGTNIVSFLKRDGRWRISGIADNGRTGARPAASR
jgi:hypothetical protein